MALPVGSQAFHNLALVCLAIQTTDGLKIGLHKAEERLGALPVAREFPHVQIPDNLGINIFTLEFVHQVGQAFGQVIAAGAGRQIRLPIQQLANELPQLQLAPQGRNRRGQHQCLGCIAVIGGHQVNGGQQAGGGAVKELLQPASHALAVHHQVDPSQGLGWLSMETLPKSRQQGCREVHARRHAIDSWRSLWPEQGEHSQGFNQGRGPVCSTNLLPPESNSDSAPGDAQENQCKAN